MIFYDFSRFTHFFKKSVCFCIFTENVLLECEKIHSFFMIFLISKVLQSMVFHHFCSIFHYFSEKCSYTRVSAQRISMKKKSIDAGFFLEYSFLYLLWQEIASGVLGDSENGFSNLLIFFRRFFEKVVPHLPAERDLK